MPGSVVSADDEGAPGVLAPGLRVRVSTQVDRREEASEWVGTLVGIDDAGIQLERERSSQVVGIPREHITRVEISRAPAGAGALRGSVRSWARAEVGCSA
jgi:hypothetical protein